ncbi:SDR family NAD(P)-dependent oxidoreductase [Oceanobacillus caeni]|uniref:SDR family NAD(P)-dependent oxidoreductase n=1 Tax=Oceanobacillus caeni TaxID=405946 RepID=UPI002E1C358B
MSEDEGNKVLQEIKEINKDALFVKHDVSKEEDWKNVVSETTKTFDKIDVLFNNAGIYIIKPIPEIDLDTWNKLMGINVTGVFLGLKHVLPVMEKNNTGSVINASSIAGLRGSAGHLLYGASKGAVRVMTKDAAAEYAGKGIRINSIHPGYITTAMADYASEATKLSKKELDATYPLGRMGDPKEVSKLVLFLASDDSSFSTGAEFVIDGGATNIL